MPKKRGQISLFLLLAVIIIVSSIVLLTAINNDSSVRQDELFTGDITASAKIYLESCIETALNDGLARIGLLGGYIMVPDDAQRYDIGANRYVTILYDTGDILLPPLSEIEQQLNIYMAYKASECADLGFIEKYGYLGETGVPKVEVVVGSSSVEATLEMPVKITQRDTIVEFDSISASVPIRLGLVHSAIENTLNAVRESDFTSDISLEKSLRDSLYDPPSFSISFLPKIEAPEGISVSYEFVDDTITLWEFEDTQSGFRYYFGTKHIYRYTGD